MNLRIKRAALLGAAVIGTGAIASLATGASFALFSATGNAQSNTFAAGTVSLGSATSVPIDLGNMAPGDTAQSSYSITYSGSLPAFLLVKVSHVGTGLGLALGAGADSNGTCIIGSGQDGTTNGGNWCTTTEDASTLDGTYLIPVDYWGQYYDSSSTASIYFVPGLSDLGDNALCTTQSPAPTSGAPYAADCGSQPGAILTDGVIAGKGDSVRVDLYTKLAPAAGNAYQGKSVKVTLQVEAVQAENNYYPNTVNKTPCSPAFLGTAGLCPTTLP